MDEKLNETPQKEFQEMKSQVTQLEDRWMRFKRKLVELAEDNQRVVKRQTEFDQEHVKICSVLETVLRGTENTSLDQTDMAVDLERVEVGVIPQEGYAVHSIPLFLLSSTYSILPFNTCGLLVSKFNVTSVGMSIKST